MNKKEEIFKFPAGVNSILNILLKVTNNRIVGISIMEDE